MKASIFLSLMLITGALILSCSRPDEQPDVNDFETFYDRFHSNPDYQMAHISFPLEGLPSNADAETIASGDFRWEAEDWQLHQPFDPANGEFKRELISFGNDMVIEKITHKNGQFGTVRRFAKLGGEWYLIYYAGLNRIAQ